MAELKALTIKGPDPEKDKVVRWRCVDLREEVARRFTVTVSERTIGRWLRALDLTRLQPRSVHPKRMRRKRTLKKFPSLIRNALLASTTAAGRPIEIWFGDEARVGQKGTLRTRDVCMSRRLSTSPAIFVNLQIFSGRPRSVPI